MNEASCCGELWWSTQLKSSHVSTLASSLERGGRMVLPQATYLQQIFLILNNKCLLLCTAPSYLQTLQIILILNNKCHHTQIFQWWTTSVNCPEEHQFWHILFNSYASFFKKHNISSIYKTWLLCKFKQLSSFTNGHFDFTNLSSWVSLQINQTW